MFIYPKKKHVSSFSYMLYQNKSIFVSWKLLMQCKSLHTRTQMQRIFKLADFQHGMMYEIEIVRVVTDHLQNPATDFINE